jgi:SAM-dependent methyltransferase
VSEFPPLRRLDAAGIAALGAASPAVARAIAPYLLEPRWIAGIDDRLSRLRLDPVRGLKAARARLREIQDAAGPEGKVAWILPNPNSWGLDADEARCVADEGLAVDAAFGIGTGDAQYTVVLGSVRRDVVGFVLTFRRLRGPGARQTFRHARRLRSSGLPIAAVLISDAAAQLASVDRLLPLAAPVLRPLVGDAAIGIWMHAHMTAGETAAAIRTVQGMAPGNPFVVARDNPMATLGTPAVLHARVDADLSWTTVEDPEEEAPLRDREGAWVRGGAYHALGFDSRVPSARPDTAPLHVARTPIPRGFAAMWSHRRGAQADLDRRLDYYRFESYLRRLDDTALAQRYHEFKVFAAAGSGPAVRTTLIDLNEQVSDLDCGLLIRECVERQSHSGGLMTVAGGSAFLAAARTEAALRVDEFGSDALSRQRTAHDYLENIPAGAPLRADVVAFVRALPDTLGRTLELGAGTGRLARELAPRASQYVCLDLTSETLPRPSGQLVSMVADVHHLALGGAQFDSVIANNVLEHASDPVAALAEVRRVLTPTGRLYALIPLDALRADYALPAHLWKADMAGIRLAVAAAGLRIERADAINLYGLGIAASFPSCNGWVCLLIAEQSGA